MHSVFTLHLYISHVTSHQATNTRLHDFFSCTHANGVQSNTMCILMQCNLECSGSPSRSLHQLNRRKITGNACIIRRQIGKDAKRAFLYKQIKKVDAMLMPYTFSLNPHKNLVSLFVYIKFQVIFSLGRNQFSYFYLDWLLLQSFLLFIVE